MAEEGIRKCKIWYLIDFIKVEKQKPFHPIPIASNQKFRIWNHCGYNREVNEIV